MRSDWEFPDIHKIQGEGNNECGKDVWGIVKREGKVLNRQLLNKAGYSGADL